jgi:hypothetical protein
MRWAGHVARMGERRYKYKILFEKHESKRPLGRSRHSWEDNIKMDLSEIVCENVDWLHMAKDRAQWRALVNTDTNLRVP